MLGFKLSAAEWTLFLVEKTYAEVLDWVTSGRGT